MSDARVALYVRIPSDQARRLDDRARSLSRAKQDVVTDLIAGCLDQVGPSAVEPHASRRSESHEVLTLPELAQLLRIREDELLGRAVLGELPGRRFGDEWRFARHAVLEWLEGTDGSKQAAGFGSRPR